MPPLRLELPVLCCIGAGRGESPALFPRINLKDEPLRFGLEHEGLVGKASPSPGGCVLAESGLAAPRRAELRCCARLPLSTGPGSLQGGAGWPPLPSVAALGTGNHQACATLCRRSGADTRALCCLPPVPGS